jgi:hypothetical protein
MIDLDTIITVGTAIAGLFGYRRATDHLADQWRRVSGLVDSTVNQVLRAATKAGRPVTSADVERWSRLMRAGADAAGIRLSSSTWRRATDLARDRLLAHQLELDDDAAAPLSERLGDVVRALESHRNVGSARRGG